MIDIKGIFSVKPAAQPSSTPHQVREQALPELRAGQLIETSVVKVGAARVLLDIGGRLFETETNLALEKNQKLAVTVVSTEPRLTLQLLDDPLAKALAKSLVGFSRQWNALDLLQPLLAETTDTPDLENPDLSSKLTAWVQTLSTEAQSGRTPNLLNLLERLTRPLMQESTTVNSPSLAVTEGLKDVAAALRQPEGVSLPVLAQALTRLVDGLVKAETVRTAQPTMSSGAPTALAEEGIKKLETTLGDWLQSAAKENPDAPKATLLKMASAIETGLAQTVASPDSKVKNQLLNNILTETARTIRTAVDSPETFPSQARVLQHLLSLSGEAPKFVSLEKLQALGQSFSAGVPAGSNEADNWIQLKDLLQQVATRLETLSKEGGPKQQSQIQSVLNNLMETLRFLGKESLQPQTAERILANLQTLGREPLVQAQIEKALKEIPLPSAPLARAQTPQIQKLQLELRQTLVPPAAESETKSFKALLKDVQTLANADVKAGNAAALLERIAVRLAPDHSGRQILQNLKAAYLGPPATQPNEQERLQPLVRTLGEAMQLKLMAGETKEVAGDVARILEQFKEMVTARPGKDHPNHLMASLKPLLQHKDVLESLSPAARKALEQFSNLQATDPSKLDGRTLKEMIGMLGLETEALLAKDRIEGTAQTLKSALTELTRTLTHPESELAAKAGQLLQDIHSVQLMRIRLEDQGFNIFPLPLPFLDQGYLVTDDGSRKNKGEKEDRGENLALYLKLSGLGDLKIDILKDQQGLSLRFMASTAQKADFLAQYRKELEASLADQGLISLIFSTGAQTPTQELSKKLFEKETLVLDTRA